MAAPNVSTAYGGVRCANSSVVNDAENSNEGTADDTDVGPHGDADSDRQLDMVPLNSMVVDGKHNGPQTVDGQQSVRVDDASVEQQRGVPVPDANIVPQWPYGLNSVEYLEGLDDRGESQVGDAEVDEVDVEEG